MTKRILLSAHHLHKTYGRHGNEVEALRGINLDIFKGESIAIVGKSGSGKSTLMHLLALLDRPTSGEIRLRGEKTSKLRAKRLNTLRNKQFGFVFQSFFMNANDSVLNNVILPLKIAGVPKKERRRRALEALEAVELGDKTRSRANDLSGGQKQRVCIARAIVNEPKIIFADEPTGNLDTATGNVITDILFRLNREKGITLVIVTHDEDLAAKCARQVHIADGKIIADSSQPQDDASETDATENTATENTPAENTATTQTHTAPTASTPRPAPAPIIPPEPAAPRPAPGPQRDDNGDGICRVPEQESYEEEEY